MSTLPLRGIAGTRIDDAGNRERAGLLGTGEDCGAAYADVERRCPGEWLLLQAARQEGAEAS